MVDTAGKWGKEPMTIEASMEYTLNRINSINTSGLGVVLIVSVNLNPSLNHVNPIPNRQ